MKSTTRIEKYIEQARIGLVMGQYDLACKICTMAFNILLAEDGIKFSFDSNKVYFDSSVTQCLEGDLSNFLAGLLDKSLDDYLEEDDLEAFFGYWEYWFDINIETGSDERLVMKMAKLVEGDK